MNIPIFEQKNFEDATNNNQIGKGGFGTVQPKISQKEYVSIIFN